MLYRDAKKGDVLFIPEAGVSYRRSETVVMEVLPSNVIVLRRAGVTKPQVLSSEEFNKAGYRPLSTYVITSDARN